jgi:hypothetical protein
MVFSPEQSTLVDLSVPTLFLFIYRTSANALIARLLLKNIAKKLLLQKPLLKVEEEGDEKAVQLQRFQLN